jgi:hypothetical protein
MRLSKFIMAFAVLLLSILSLYLVAPQLTQYARFRHKSDAYYSELTKAFDTMLAEHPIGTNRCIELSVTDPSLPKVVRDLRPLKVQVWRERVWILHGGSIEFGVEWQRDELRTNVWTLSTACESDVRVIYVAGR